MTFDERIKARARRENCPLPEGFEMRLTARVEALTADGKKEERPMKKRVFRTGLLAAALCAALMGAALATSPTLRELVAAAWGSFAPYSQTVEGVSAVDQGIEVKVVSALMDTNDGTAYVEVRDLEGDRLGESIWMMGGCALGSAAYDPETGTVLFKVPLHQAYHKLERGETQDLELSFDRIYTQRVELSYEEVETVASDGSTYSWWQGEVSIPAELYRKAETLECITLTKEEVEKSSGRRGTDLVLAPEQTPMDLGSPYFSLSSLGFDEEGSLHVQFKLAEGVHLMYCGDLDIDILPGLLMEDVGLENGLSYTRLLFGEGRYLDVRLQEVTKDLAERLPDSTIYGYVFTAPPIEGEWHLEIPFAPLPERVVELDRALFCAEGMALDDVRLTAMSLRLTATKGTERVYLGGLQAHLFCRDGTVLPLKYSDMSALYVNAAGTVAPGETLTYDQHQGADGWQEYGGQYSWAYPQAVDPKEVIGFSWGQWYVPLEGDTPGQGYWLPALPEATS